MTYTEIKAFKKAIKLLEKKKEEKMDFLVKDKNKTQKEIDMSLLQISGMVLSIYYLHEALKKSKTIKTEKC